jgi:hypothetical protein
MKTITFVALAACAVAGPVRAADPPPDPLTSYKSDIAREAPNLVNGNFIADHAVSRAKRAVRRAGIDETLGAIGDPADRGGDVNIASPQIYGRVRGDVTVVMERGAVRGDVTSVRR